VIIQHGHLITLGKLTGVQFLAKPLLGRDLITGPPETATRTRSPVVNKPSRRA